MKSTLIVALSIALFVVNIDAQTTNKPGSYSGEAKKRKDTSHDVVKPKGPGSKEYEGDCELTEALHNISLTLSSSHQVIMNVFIQDMIDTVLVDVNLSPDELVVRCALKLKRFKKKHPDIANLISFKEIGVWGYVQDFEYVAVDLQVDIADSIITLDANDDCDLFDALLNATASDSVKHSAVIELIFELKLILKDVTLTKAQKKAKFHEHFKMFFEAHSDWELFFDDIEVNGFGPLESFKDVCRGYHRALTGVLVLSGSSDSDSPLLQALSVATANSTFTISVRSQIKQFHDKIAAYFVSEVDISLRLAYVSQQFYQLIIIEPFIVQAMMQIDINVNGELWGTFYDLEWCSQMCKNSGSCGNLDEGLGTTPVPTTPVGTTPVPTTPVPTTTIQPHNCGSRGNLIAVTAQNTTILTDVLTANYNTWNASIKLSFNSCFNKIRKAIWDNVAFPTVSAKLTECKNSFNGYSPNNLNMQNIVMNIYISSWQGTIRNFCDC